MNSLVLLTPNEYAEKTVEGVFKQSAYSSLVWTGKGLTVTLLNTYYSESGTAMSRIQMGSIGKNVSISFMGNSNDVERATRSLASFLDMILPKS